MTIKDGDSGGCPEKEMRGTGAVRCRRKEGKKRGAAGHAGKGREGGSGA